MSNETTKFPLDKTAQLDAQFVDKLLESIKTLDEIYERKKQMLNFKNGRSLIEFQNKFWLDSMATFEKSAKKLDQIGQIEQNDEIDQTLLDYHILAALHKHKINEHWSISDSESRKQTILIALAELGELNDEILSKIKGTNQSSKTISIIDLKNHESGEKSDVCIAIDDDNNNRDHK